MKCQEIRGHNIISTSQHHNDNDRLEEGLNHFFGIVEIAMEWKNRVKWKNLVSRSPKQNV